MNRIKTGLVALLVSNILVGITMIPKIGTSRRREAYIQQKSEWIGENLATGSNIISEGDLHQYAEEEAPNGWKDDDHIIRLYHVKRDPETRKVKSLEITEHERSSQKEVTGFHDIYRFTSGIFGRTEHYFGTSWIDEFGVLHQSPYELQNN